MTLNAFANKYANVSAFHGEVNRWRADNPPPVDWEDTPVAWAYTEMPHGKYTIWAIAAGAAFILWMAFKR
jgi:hypothetical protein